MHGFLSLFLLLSAHEYWKRAISSPCWRFLAKPKVIFYSVEDGKSRAVGQQGDQQGVGGLAASLREEGKGKSKSRQSTQESEGRRSSRTEEQVPKDGRRHLWRGGERTGNVGGQGGDGGEESSGLLENKKRQIYRVLFFNARSIVSKVDLLQTELHARSSKPDIICICETFCNDQQSDAYV